MTRQFAMESREHFDTAVALPLTTFFSPPRIEGIFPATHIVGRNLVVMVEVFRRPISEISE
jgi:hypothetical protein